MVCVLDKNDKTRTKCQNTNFDRNVETHNSFGFVQITVEKSLVEA